ncbi:MAG: hypothetical protein DLM73_12090 [Chthoniobacterales bacterium]|nr:MAG: hypothetical protein DLM73_12090 [Chthoniobacterales bacterium]
MTDEKNWEKWEGPGGPEGKGGTSIAASSGPDEVEGRNRQFVAVCATCGMQTYIGADWKWFTCWKCGGTNSEMIA